MGINNVVWTPASRELSFRANDSLDQHTTYAVVVTTGVRDASGLPIGAAENFRRTISVGDTTTSYSRALIDADSAVRRAGVLGRGQQIAALSVFTTQTATHIVERMHAAILAAPAPAFNFNVGQAGERAVFPAAQIAALTNNAQTRTTGPLVAETIPLAIWSLSGRLTVGTAAFGTFRTLDFTTRPSGHVAPIATVPARSCRPARSIRLQPVPAGRRAPRRRLARRRLQGRLVQRQERGQPAALDPQRPRVRRALVQRLQPRPRRRHDDDGAPH